MDDIALNVIQLIDKKLSKLLPFINFYIFVNIRVMILMQLRKQLYNRRLEANLSLVSDSRYFRLNT